MLRPPTCVVISPSEGYHGKQGFDYIAGISAQTADLYAHGSDPAAGQGRRP